MERLLEHAVRVILAAFARDGPINSNVPIHRVPNGERMLHEDLHFCFSYFNHDGLACPIRSVR